MNDDWIEDQALRFEGYTDDQIAQIKIAIPKFLQLVQIAEKNEVLATQVLNLVKDVLPTLDMILTVIKDKRT
jgi:hypothetical protein